MIKMGFAKDWVDLVMRCLSSTSYSVIVNGCRGSNFTLTRGLR